MTGLIIAAGKGSRMAALGPSKPLVPLLGVPLIEWVIRTAHRSGLDSFCVVTGHNGDHLGSFLEQLAWRMQVGITVVRNEEWQRGNGLSVLKGREVVAGPFVLLMADHVFDAETLIRLQREPLKDGQVVLAVDFGVESNDRIDSEDVTKVRVEDGMIAAIGKDLPLYNGYDTGLFLCSSAIFAAIDTSCTLSKDFTVSGAMRVLCREGRARPFDIGNRFWMDVDNEQDLRKAEEVLDSRCREFLRA